MLYTRKHMTEQNNSVQVCLHDYVLWCSLFVCVIRVQQSRTTLFCLKSVTAAVTITGWVLGLGLPDSNSLYHNLVLHSITTPQSDHITCVCEQEAGY